MLRPTGLKKPSASQAELASPCLRPAVQRGLLPLGTTAAMRLQVWPSLGKDKSELAYFVELCVSLHWTKGTCLLLINAAVVCTPSPRQLAMQGSFQTRCRATFLELRTQPGSNKLRILLPGVPVLLPAHSQPFGGLASQEEAPVVHAPTPAAPAEPSQPPQQHSSNAKRPSKARFRIERKPVRRHPLTEGMQLPQDALREVGSMFTTAQKLGVQDVVLQRAADSLQQLFEHSGQT